MQSPSIPLQALSYEPMIDRSWQQIANIVTVSLIIWSAVAIYSAGMSALGAMTTWSERFGATVSVAYGLMALGELLAGIVSVIAAIFCLKRSAKGRRVAMVCVICIMGFAIARQSLWFWGMSKGVFRDILLMTSVLFGIVSYLIAPGMIVALLMHREMRRIFEYA